MLNYESKQGFEICKGSGSDRYIMLRRFDSAGKFETLFIARFKYNRAGSKATAYAKQLQNLLGDQALQTITQDGLDEYRAAVNEMEHKAFLLRQYGTTDKLRAAQAAAK